MIKHLDHLVLTVKDRGESIKFYTTVLGMKEETFGEGRKSLHFGSQKMNLHTYDNTLDPKAAKPTMGSMDLCFITSLPLEEAIAHVKSCGVKIIEGPVERTGAISPLLSFYIRDPDGNLIEIANTKANI